MRTIHKKALIFFAATAIFVQHALANKKAAEAASSFEPLQSFFDECDRLFFGSVDVIESKFNHIDDAFSKNMKTTVEEIRKQAHKMQQITSEGLYRLHGASSSTLSNMLESMSQKMKESAAIVDNLIQKVEQGVDQSKKFAQYSVEEFKQDDQEIYGFKISMPGFDQSDMTVTINKQEDRSYGVKKKLEICAQKNEMITDEKVIDKKVSEEAEKISHQMRSVSLINGRKQELNYQDGQLKIILDLPVFVDEESYKMSFENNILKVEFSKKANGSERKSLTFSDQK